MKLQREAICGLIRMGIPKTIPTLNPMPIPKPIVTHAFMQTMFEKFPPGTVLFDPNGDRWETLSAKKIEDNIVHCLIKHKHPNKKHFIAFIDGYCSVWIRNMNCSNDVSICLSNGYLSCSNRATACAFLNSGNNKIVLAVGYENGNVKIFILTESFDLILCMFEVPSQMPTKVPVYQIDCHHSEPIIAVLYKKKLVKFILLDLMKNKFHCSQIYVLRSTSFSEAECLRECASCICFLPCGSGRKAVTGYQHGFVVFWDITVNTDEEDKEDEENEEDVYEPKIANNIIVSIKVLPDEYDIQQINAISFDQSLLAILAKSDRGTYVFIVKIAPDRRCSDILGQYEGHFAFDGVFLLIQNHTSITINIVARDRIIKIHEIESKNGPIKSFFFDRENNLIGYIVFNSAILHKIRLNGLQEVPRLV
jgi:WD40 repeat protein